jgi:Tfp pilus assembly protein PilE
MNPMDLVPLVAVFMGCLIVLVPVAGITARIALKPIMESWARYRELRGNDEVVALLQQRMSLMEEHLHSIDRTVNRLAEDADFRRRLDAGGPPPAALPATDRAAGA